MINHSPPPESHMQMWYIQHLTIILIHLLSPPQLPRFLSHSPHVATKAASWLTSTSDSPRIFLTAGPHYSLKNYWGFLYLLLFYCRDKICNHSHLGREGLMRAHSIRMQSIMRGHTAISVRQLVRLLPQSRCRSEDWCKLTFPLFPWGSVQEQSLGNGATHIWGRFRFSAKPLWKFFKTLPGVCLLSDSKPCQAYRRDELSDTPRSR